MVLLNLSVLLVPGAKDPQAVGSSPPPFRWLLWLCVWGLVPAHRPQDQDPVWQPSPDFVVHPDAGSLLWPSAFYPTSFRPPTPVTMSYWAAIAYELLWALLCQVWQTVHYNRCAARHPWQGGTVFLKASSKQRTPGDEPADSSLSGGYRVLLWIIPLAQTVYRRNSCLRSLPRGSCLPSPPQPIPASWPPVCFSRCSAQNRGGEWLLQFRQNGVAHGGASHLVVQPGAIMSAVRSPLSSTALTAASISSASAGISKL